MTPTLREWLNEQRRERGGISLRQVALEAGVQPSIIRNINSMLDCRPKEPTLRKLARWGGVSFDWLYNVTYGRPRSESWPHPAIEHFPLSPEDDIHARIDRARANIPSDVLSKLDPLLTERGVDLEGRLSAYEIFARDFGSHDAAQSSIGRGDQRGCDQSGVTECGDIPLR